MMGVQTDRIVPHSRWTRIGAILFLIYLFAFMDRTNISVAAIPMAKDLELSSFAMGAIMSSFFWGYVITQIPGGYVATKFRAKWVIVIALVIWGVFSGLTGLMHTKTSLETTRIIMGLAEGVVWPSFTVFISRWYPGAERARATGLLLATLPFSALVMTPLAGWMIAQWDWHVMFYLQAIPAIIMAVVLAFFASDDPATDRFISSTERDYLVTLRQQDEAHERAQGPRAPIFKSFAIPQMWLLALIYLLWITGLYAFSLWLPTVVEHISHQGITSVGLLSAIPFLIGLVALVLNAVASDRSGKRPLYIIWPLIVGGLAFIVGHFISLSNIYVNFILLCIESIGIYAPFGPWWAWGIEQVPHEHVGTMMGFINFSGNFGGIVGPVAVTVAATGAATYTGFYVLGAAMVVAGILVLVARNAKLRSPVLIKQDVKNKTVKS